MGKVIFCAALKLHAARMLPHAEEDGAPTKTPKASPQWQRPPQAGLNIPGAIVIHKLLHGQDGVLCSPEAACSPSAASCGGRWSSRKDADSVTAVAAPAQAGLNVAGAVVIRQLLHGRDVAHGEEADAWASPARHARSNTGCTKQFGCTCIDTASLCGFFPILGGILYCLCCTPHINPDLGLDSHRCH